MCLVRGVRSLEPTRPTAAAKTSGYCADADSLPVHKPRPFASRPFAVRLPQWWAEEGSISEGGQSKLLTTLFLKAGAPSIDHIV
jgi:hypothetical protein